MISDPTLLVVDDEQVYCDGCERIFSRQGFRVEGSNDATKALKLATKNDYSAILLDVKMPNMDGIRFLEHLRAARPDTPVILMTGYPSIQNAASAVRLGASDYVIKPFTPEQITTAVRGLLRTEEPVDEEAGSENAAADAEENQPDGLLFQGRAWAHLGDRMAVRVGGVVPRNKNTAVEIHLPRVGDTVHQGLPLFAVHNAEGATTVISSPVTGIVLDVNSELQNNPDLLWSHACGLGWVAKIAPTRLDAEEARLQKREILAVTDNQEFRAFYRDKLRGIGCAVCDVKPSQIDALLEAARTAGAILLDAASCGNNGPELVGRVLAEVPETKVVVVAPSGIPQQDAYRTHRLFYYAVLPLEDAEILDIVDSCYRLPAKQKTEAPVPSSQNLPISALHVDIVAGTRVTLLAPNGLILREVGLGLALRSKLLERLLPLETGLGDLKLTPTRVLREAAGNQRVVVLMTADMSRIPGSMARYRHGSLTEFVGVEAENVTVLAIQSLPGNPAMPKLDPAAVEALAEHILHEILA